MPIPLGIIVAGSLRGTAPVRAVFRAVCHTELKDLGDSGVLRPATDGPSLEAKLFAATLPDAAAFGSANFGQDWQEVFTIAVLLTDAGYGLLEEGWADGRRILAADRDDLPSLNDEVVLVVALERNAWQ